MLDIQLLIILHIVLFILKSYLTLNNFNAYFYSKQKNIFAQFLKKSGQIDRFVLSFHYRYFLGGKIL